MNSRRVVAPLACMVVFALTAAVGCNAILGNEEGKALAADGGGSAPLEAGMGDSGIQQQQSCDPGQGNKVCFGLCVKIDQTNTGCGGASCAACDPKNVNATVCKGGATTLECNYDSCKAGFDNCDGQPGNGCETSLNAKSSCGSCTTECNAPTPLCALQGANYGCVDSCPSTAPTDCSGACVDTTSSVDHCGGCDRRCSRASASATCVDSTCKFVCNGGTHECNGACVPEEDPDTCGPGCLPCRGGDNTVRTCIAGQCGLSCMPGYLDCDGDEKNGCEVKDDLCSIPPICNNCSFSEQCCNGVCIDIGKPCAKNPPPPLP